MVAADSLGESPRETAERFNGLIREDLLALGPRTTFFTRTTTKNHYSVTQDSFRTLFENGYVIEQETLGAFSASTGHTLPDRYIEGTCPICGYESARGDQCDNCGNQLDPADLIEPRSTIDGTPPVFRLTKHLFLDLPAFKEQLTAWIEGQEHWRPNVRRFSLNFVKELKPRPITRDLDWGVPIPVAGYNELADKRIYVWFDARHRVPLRVHRVGGEPRYPGCLARVVAESHVRAHVLHGEGQHRLSHRDLAEHALGLRRRRVVRRRTRPARATRQRSFERVPHDGRQEVQL
jgi:methionyl-tRNA synthetase